MAGRLSVYKAQYAEQAYKLCLLGATDKELADFFEVDESTINNWKSKHRQFLESIKKGKNQGLNRHGGGPKALSTGVRLLDLEEPK